MQDEFGVGEGDFKIKKITTRTGKGFGMTTSGRYVDLKSGAMVRGYARSFSSGYTDIHVSPYYSTGDVIDFSAVAGHELIHAYHHYAFPNVTRVYTERVAYKYTYDVYMSNGRFIDALSAVRTAMFNSGGSFWGPYPAQYQIPSIYRF